MSIKGMWDTSQLDDFLDDLKGLVDEEVEEFMINSIKEVAARTLAKIVERTPVGEYKDEWVEFIAYKGTDKEKEVSFFAENGKDGGTLKRGWTADKEIDPYEYVYNYINVIKRANEYIIILSNDVDYAYWVENGHETVNGGWVDGKFMMKISEDEMNGELEVLLSERLEEFIGGIL